MVVLRFILLLLAAIQCMLSVCLANDGVTIDVVPATGSIYDTFTMTVDIEWEYSSGKVALLPSNNFEVIGRGRNVSVDLSGGNISQTIQHKFVLKPLREGVLELPVVRIVPRRGQSQDFKGKSVRIQQGPVANDPLSTNLRFTQSVDNLEVFQGQQILNTIELERKIDLDDLSISTPMYADAWVESLEQNNIRTRVDKQGNRSIVHTISNVLYPTKPGVIKLPRRTMTATALFPNQRQAHARGYGASPFGSRSPFDSFGMFPSRYRRQPIEMDSNDLEITVQALPEPPADFSSWESSIPIVGKTEIELSYDARPVSVGDSRTLIFKIRSEGNIAPIKSIPLPTIKGVKLYEESPERKTHHDGGRMIMTATIPVTLVPIAAQDINIPSLSLGFFDPETLSYQRATTEALTIKVSGSPSTDSHDTVTAPQLPSHETVQNPNPPEEDLIQNPVVSDQGLPVFSKKSWLEDLLERYSLFFFVYWFLAALVILAIGILLYWYSIKTSKKRAIRTRLRQAQEPGELRSVYLDCVGMNLGVVPGDADSLKQSLEKTTLSNDVKFELLTLYDELSFLCYSGEETDSERLLSVRHRLETITHRL